MFGITHAPDFDQAGLVWFNVAAPLSLTDLRGRLVILDFWTFCCVNCLHTLPTLRRIEENHPAEVVVIGIHSPKFAHECGTEALASAILRYDIRHPVIQDPHTALWDEYCIRAWPSLVFISPDGMVIGQMAGEPDPDLLMHGIAAMLERFWDAGTLTPQPLPRACLPTPQTAGTLRFPGKIKGCPTIDGGKLWAIADSGHHQIVLVDDGGTEVKRWGTGQPGFADGGVEACFNGPEGLACDGTAIYVADTRNHAVRRIDRISDEVTTLAGVGLRGGILPPGPSAAGQAALASPWDLEVHGGHLYFANAGSHQIGRLDLAAGLIEVLAGGGGEDIVDGPGTDAQLAQPSGLALCPLGTGLYFTDAETSSVRRLSLNGDHRVSTVVGTGLFAYGSDDGPCDRASLQHPLGLTAEGGRLVIADSYNSAVRVVDLAQGSVSSLTPACADPLCRPWSEPAGIIADGSDRLLLSDTNNHRIVEIRLDLGISRTWMT